MTSGIEYVAGGGYHRMSGAAVKTQVRHLRIVSEHEQPLQPAAPGLLENCAAATLKLATLPVQLLMKR